MIFDSFAVGVLKDATTGRETGLYTPDRTVKIFTGVNAAQDALNEISKKYGNDEFDIYVKVKRTYTEIITT
jgi:hypothetical protein